MAYQYVRAVGVYINGNGGETIVDLTGVPTNTLASTFAKLAIVYNDSLYKTNYVIRLEDYSVSFNNFSGDIIAWFTAQANNVLEYDDSYPGSAYVYAQAGDLQDYGYKYLPGDHQQSSDRQDLLTPSGCADVRVTQIYETRDWKSIVNTNLFTLNGHFIRAVGLTDALYLIGGGKNYRVNDNINVEGIDFKNLTTLNTYPFTQDMISFVNDNSYHSLQLNLGMDTSNKTVWFVLGGRLMFNYPLLKRIGDQSFRIDFRQCDLMTRLFESLNYIDLSDVMNQEQEVVTALFPFSTTTLTDLLLNTNSFFIVFDTPALGVTIKPLETFTYPTTFFAHDTFTHPLMLNNGLFPAYKTKVQNNDMLINTGISYVPELLNHTTGVSNGGDLYHSYENLYSKATPVQGYSFKIHVLK